MPTESGGNPGRPHRPLQAAKANSRTVATIASHRSRLSRLTERVATRLANAYRGSHIQRIEHAYPSSSLSRFAQWSAQTARQSWLYRWLTKEPDPDVIVIDLRKTWTVGPLLAVLERVLVPFKRAVTSAASTKLAQRVAKHPIPLASAALLGVLVTSLVQTWPANPFLLAAYAIGFVAAGLGLTLDDSRTALTNSHVVALLVAALEPPETSTDEGQT